MCFLKSKINNLGHSMSFKEKMLSKSNSFVYYKENNEKLLKEVESLKKEIEYLKSDKREGLKEEFLKTYGFAISFCNKQYMDYYLKDDFEDNLKEVTKNLDKESKDRFKIFFLRSLFVHMITRDSLYSEEELSNQKVFREFERINSEPNKLDGLNFFGSYNIHAFIDLNLDEDDKEFLKDKDIIDAGAFTGDTSLPLSKITDKKVYAFEPFEDSFNLLKMNVEKNNIGNIVPINKSLGNMNGERSLFLSGENVQGITSDPNIRSYDEEIKVHEITVDKFVQENNIDVGFITVDVEGAELALLEGAINTIKSQKPILCISIYHKVSDYFDIIPWIANLNLGYEFEVFKEQPWPFIADTVVKARVK